MLSHVVVKQEVDALHRSYLKGGYSEISHLTELEKIYIPEIYMRKQYKYNTNNQ